MPRPLPFVAATALIGVLVVAPAVSPSVSLEAAPFRATTAQPYVTGHRGEPAAAPENTMPAFRASVANGADLLEADVRLTSDEVPVVLHDKTVDRTTDGEGAVKDLTAAQVRALDAGSWYGAEFAGTRIPEFDELLDYLAYEATDVRLIVDVKNTWNVARAGLLIESVRERGLTARVVFASFSEKTLLALREAGPESPRALLVEELPPFVVSAASRVGAIAVITRLEELEARPQVVGQLHGAGLSVLLYTLNDEDVWDAASRLEVDGIITDSTAELRSWMADAQESSSSAR
ncbi:glycerophosphodiester phosphodiesterase [Pseudolysinimonas sp.]